MRGPAISRLWGIITGVIAIGLIVYLILVALTAQAISVELKEIRAVRYKMMDNNIEVEFVVKVVNNGLTDIEIEKLYYEVYIEGKYLGSGEKENIIIHRGENEIILTLETTPTSVIKTMLLTLTQNEIEITVKGKILFPIKSFGVIRLWTAEIPFEKTETVVLELT
ncbi:LEA type 2 family protein [Desulfurococcaceae archaeon MEX13E-LK6-19]|nr:LEA type 2 family protein [Desulfurococcaceae archaeon MEX13E-LK6-19]